MDISLDDIDGLLPSGSTTLLLGPQGAVLRIDLGPDEVLDGIELRLVRSAGAPVSPVALPVSQLSTDGPASPLSSLTWVAADLGATRSLDRFTLSFSSKPNPLTVRLRVARGGSAWYPPPGPQSFAMAGALSLTGSFPDTVADRLMLEMFVDGGAAGEVPATVDLTAPSPLTVTYGQHARELGVGLLGGRRLLRVSGEAPAGEGVEVAGLLELLEDELGEGLRGQSIELEIGADVAGEVTLQWVLSSSRVQDRFGEQAQAEEVFSVGWGETVTRALPLPTSHSSELLQLELRVDSDPQLERVVLSPVSSAPSVGSGQLSRPLYDVAQALTLSDSRSLVGVDVYARAIGSPPTPRAALHADQDGRPAVAPLVELTASTMEIGAEPAWVPFTVAEPIDMPTAPYWLVLSVDEGELLWLVDSQRPSGAGALRVRRDGGPWISRTGTGERPWAMTRLRVLESSPPPSPTIELVGFSAEPDDPAQEPDFVVPLRPDDDGRLRWSPADPDLPPTVAQLGLRIASTVATTITLSELVLRHRPLET
ncbi:MAG: hypothetical protein AB1Z98_32120 [Nannocystaceae bacterium]